MNLFILVKILYAIKCAIALVSPDNKIISARDSIELYSKPINPLSLNSPNSYHQNPFALAFTCMPNKIIKV